MRVQPAWEAVEIAWDDANVPLKAALDNLMRLASSMDDLESFDVPDVKDLQIQIVGIARQLEEIVGHVGQIITQPTQARIY